MEQANKPKAGVAKLIGDLGPAVEVETVKIENDKWAQKMQSEIGKTLQPKGMVWKCSISTHCYIFTDPFTGNTDIAFMHVMPDLADNLNQQVTALWHQDLGLRMRAKFGHQYKTTSQFDKRDDFQE